MDSNDKPKRCRRKCWFFPFAILGVIALKSAVVFFLWNALIPDLFHLPSLTYVQALGLLILSKVLFGGFKGRHHGHFARHYHWKKHWEGLSPEEREKLRDEFRNRCGH